MLLDCTIDHEDASMARKALHENCVDPVFSFEMCPLHNAGILNEWRPLWRMWMQEI